MALLPAPGGGCTTKKESLLDLRENVDKHIKNNSLKRADAPIGVGPVLKCWTELNG